MFRVIFLPESDIFFSLDRLASVMSPSALISRSLLAIMPPA